MDSKMEPWKTKLVIDLIQALQNREICMVPRQHLEIEERRFIQGLSPKPLKNSEIRIIFLYALQELQETAQELGFYEMNYPAHKGQGLRKLNPHVDQPELWSQDR